MQQIDSTTFTANGLGDVKPNVTIGGKDKIKFIPNINMSYHDDEFFINLNRKDKQATTATDKPEIGGIDKDIFHIDDQGRFKWDIEFSSRPAVNSWTWELKHTKGIEFYYQGELTPEEIADGCERPEEVVGSYAVYCNKANNKYKTGKLCHIYRPFCYDAKGNTIYADLLIADGQLTITIDKTWLDSAVYPVRLDPTFGYTTKGASSVAASSGYAFATRFTAPESGTATSITAYIKSTVAYSWKYALYEYNSSGNEILKSGTAEGSGIVDGWSELDMVTTQSIAAVEYAIAQQGNNTDVTFYYDIASGNNEGFASRSYSSDWADISFTFSNDYKFSIYATYTESGGATGNTYYYQQMQM